MRDICERAAMDESRVVFQRLHQIGRQRVTQQRRHRTGCLEIGRAHRFAVARGADNDVGQPPMQVFEVL